MPVALALKNGFLDPACIDHFVKYCVTLFERYKGKVKYWILLNQINCLGGWGDFHHLVY